MNEKRWYVYILRNARGHFYIGVTTDVDRRLREHNGEITGGARFTRSHRPYVLEYRETCASRGEAQVRESILKKLTRAEKEIFVRKLKG